MRGFEPYAHLIEPLLERETDWHNLCDLAMSHTGTLRRLTASLNRGIARGEVVIGVAGGSCSVGTMCDDDLEQRWYRKMKFLFEQYMLQNGLGEVSVRIVNFSQGGTGAERIFYCLEEFVNAMNVSKLDVLILEYAINDPDATWVELLIRRLPAETGVFFLETFSAAAHSQRQFGTSQIYHDALARYYDVPVVSARDAFWELFRQQPELRSHWLSIDEHHPSCFGHSTLGLFAADVLIRSLNRPKLDHISVNYGGFLDVTDNKPPDVLLSSRPRCMLASAGSASRCNDTFDGFECERVSSSVNHFQEWSSNSSWIVNDSRKPSFDCNSPADGQLEIPLDCTEAVQGADRGFCQVVIGFVKSWKPRGTALIIKEDGTNITIDGYEVNWFQQHYTLLWHTSIDMDFLKIPVGETRLRISCTGSSTAREDLDELSTLFQLSSVILI